MSGRPRLKFVQSDILIGIAALDIVVNLAPKNPAFNYTIGEKLMHKLRREATKPHTRLNILHSRTVLQAVRLALSFVGTSEMITQARPILDKLERYVNDI